MGDLPNDVRTHFVTSGDKENVLLAGFLLHNNEIGVKIHTIQLNTKID
jgi:hypothetical protein